MNLAPSCALVAICLTLSFLPGHADDIKTLDGKTYKNVKVIKVEDDAVTILCDDGGARISLTALPVELQRKFNYDPEKAKVAAAKYEEDRKASLEAIENEKASITAKELAEQKAADNAKIANQTVIQNSQIISDLFNDTTVNKSVWQISLPFEDSSITEEGAGAIFKNRGRLLSVAKFPTAYAITGSFSINNKWDAFKLVLRTDGVESSSSGEFNGISVRFQQQVDSGNTSENIAIALANGSNSRSLASATTIDPIKLNTFYNFKITDDGNKVSIYFNDSSSPILTTTSTFSVGSQLGIYNREGADGGSSISNGAITVLKEIQVSGTK